MDPTLQFRLRIVGAAIMGMVDAVSRQRVTPPREVRFTDLIGPGLHPSPAVAIDLKSNDRSGGIGGGIGALIPKPISRVGAGPSDHFLRPEFRGLLRTMGAHPAIWVVYVTAPPEEAPELARALVDRRLAACVNLVPVRSVYRWQGSVQDDPETLLVVKTTASRFEALRNTVVELHSYDLPEVVALPATDALPAYALWVRHEVEGPA